jgi:Domain of unknown function (DUF4276)
MNILPIVEGPGDMEAVPVLLRRILALHECFDAQVLPAHKRGDLPNVKANFDNYFKMAIKENAAIIWIIDFDCATCDCVADEADQLYKKARLIRPDWPFKVAFMVKEFETLFLADPEAARSVLKEIPKTTVFPATPETIRDAKGWLSKAMPSGYAYKETTHQVKLAAAVNLDHLRTASASYRHLEKSILTLLNSPSNSFNTP